MTITLPSWVLTEEILDLIEAVALSVHAELATEEPKINHDTDLVMTRLDTMRTYIRGGADPNT